VGTQNKIYITKHEKDTMFKSENNAVTLSFNAITKVSFRYTGGKMKMRI